MPLNEFALLEDMTHDNISHKRNMTSLNIHCSLTVYSKHSSGLTVKKVSGKPEAEINEL